MLLHLLIFLILFKLVFIQGYLGVTLLMHENNDLARLVINSIRKDLEELNEIYNCLALHAIANIGGREMAESLSFDVHRLLISP
jgi:AP-2 complex subunit alpha